MDAKETLASCMQELEAGAAAFPWLQRPCYADWVAQTYYYVCHSTRLLAAAAARFGLDERGQALHVRFSAHMGEESRHELLAAHDLRALGHTLDEFPERHTTRAFYEPQYYKIEHQSPMALFGYILPLEMMAVELGGPLLATLRDAYGKEAVSFLKVHANEDPDHVTKAYANLEHATPAERSLIDINLRQSTAMYLAILREIAETRTESRPNR